jgi:two-component system response regulator VicR
MTPPVRRILVVEDDPGLARILRDNLVIDGFDVECVADGNRAVTLAHTFAPDLALLDVTLPGINGFDLCQRWSQTRKFPIILLTARGQKADKLRGLSMGADDYVTKPFDLEELLARIHAVLRRTRRSVSSVMLGTILVDFERFQAWNGSEQLDLTYREFELLRYLAERPSVIVHRDELLRDIWRFPEAPPTRAVDHAIARLRKKIERDPHHPEFIHTVHGDGYCLTPDGPATTPHV